MRINNQAASKGFIFTTVLVDVIGLGVIIPVIPELLLKLGGGSLGDSALISGFLTFSFAFMQFLFAPLMGILSDKLGRRPVLLAALLGLGLDYFVMGLAPNLAWLFASRIVAGIAGSSFTVANAYMADISTPENKAQNFGLIGAAFGLGFVIGPALGGLAGQIRIELPFFIAGGLSILNFLFGLIVLPESLSREKRQPIEWSKANPISSLRYLAKMKRVIGLIAAFFVVYIASHALQSTWTFFTIAKFKWDTSMIGYSLTVVGLLVAIVQGGLVKPIVARIGSKQTVVLGYALWALGMVLFATMPNQWLLLAALAPYCLGGIATPTIQSVISNNVPDTEQGKLQGALTSLISISSIVGPLIMTAIFYGFTNENGLYFPGAPFIMGSILIVLAFAMAWTSIRKFPSKSGE